MKHTAMLAAIAGVFAFAAASGAALEDGNGLLGRRAAWMQGRCGIMVHWLYPSYRDVDRWTDAFDVPAFLEDFEATGADWLVFTAGQCKGAYASPNATFERLCGDGHLPKRDLLLEIAKGVKALGKRFIVYSAVDFVKDGCDDHSMQKGLCWDESKPDRREFEKRWSSVLREWSLRLGDLCDGWWLDGCARYNYRAGVDWRTWLDACRAGNPRSAVAFNGGVNEPAEPWGPSDYFAGEISCLDAIEDVAGLMLPCENSVRHYLFPIDGYWGAYWPWPVSDWAKAANLRKVRPDLFDKEKMAALESVGEFPDPAYSAARLCAFAKTAAATDAGVTLNIGISPKGRLNPKSVELAAAVSRILAVPAVSRAADREARTSARFPEAFDRWTPAEAAEIGGVIGERIAATVTNNLMKHASSNAHLQTVRFEEFADPENTVTYFRVPDPEGFPSVDDELFAGGFD